MKYVYLKKPDIISNHFHVSSIKLSLIYWKVWSLNIKNQIMVFLVQRKIQRHICERYVNFEPES